MTAPTDRPRIAHEPISVLLPIRDQADALEPAVKAWASYLNGLGRAYQLLIVDDGSADATPARCADLSATFAKVQVLRHEQPRGIGAALRTGLEVARHPLVLYTTLSEPYQPADLKKLLERIDASDMVNGYRAGRPAPAGWHWLGLVWRIGLRVVLGVPSEPSPGWLGVRAHVFARIVRTVFGVPVGDVNSGFKLYRRAVLERTPIQSDGAFVHAELLGKVNFLGCLLDEVPVARKPGPFPAVPVPPTTLGATLREAWLVFKRPQFAPPPTAPAPEADGAPLAAPAGGGK